MSTSFAQTLSNSDDFEAGTSIGVQPNQEPCCHSTLHQFDSNTMTVNGVYEGNTVEALIHDVGSYSDNHRAVVLRNGMMVTGGYLEAGMTVQIFHGRELYGMYVIRQLLSPAETGNSIMSSNTNFFAPICGMIFSSQTTGNLSCR